MDVEESIRANPLDGVVLLMGCDKTTPALLMGAASVDLPTIGVSGGPMLSGKFRGGELGSGTGVWQMSEAVRAGTMSQADFFEAESCMHRSHGHCMTMGTASTMASMVEALGMGLPGNAAYPAVDGRRNVLARMAGRRIVQMVEDDIAMSNILTRGAFENAIRTNAAICGSTNAVIHLLALAGRVGAPLALDDWDRLGHDLPCLVDLQPSAAIDGGLRYAGAPAQLREPGPVLNRDTLTVNGLTIWDNVRMHRVVYDLEVRNVVSGRWSIAKAKAGIAVLRATLRPTVQ
jgi:dihydroxy-acid dehydratase